MNSYSIDSDSPRWWWPQAAAGAVATVAITAIIVVPTAGVALPGGSTRDVVPPPDPWFSNVDPGSDRQCFMTRLPWNVGLDYHQPRCGHVPTGERQEWYGVIRPHLSSTP